MFNIKDSLIINSFISLRPKQWLKNLFIFAPILFSQNIYDYSMLKINILVYIYFCILCSGVYLINDVIDKKKDSIHPVKKNRPIASGKISVQTAAGLAGVLVLFSLYMCYRVNFSTGAVALLYFLQTLLYSFFLKNIVILDILIIAFGFVLRVVAGAVSISVEVSAWLLVCITLLSLFLALCKRLNEMRLLNQKACSHRKILSEYTPELVNQMIGVVTSSTVIVYSLYTFFSHQSKYFMLTIPFVIYGIFRYLYLVYKQEEGGDPTNLIFKDKAISINISLWVVSVYLVLYIIPK